MDQIKRRATNFSDSEQRLLSRIVIKYLPIIENKSNDNATNGAKEEAWREITASFNAANSGREVRMIKTVKSKYNKIKERSIHFKRSRPFVYAPNIVDIKKIENNLLAICSNNSSMLSASDSSDDSDNFSNNQPPSSAENTVYNIKNEIVEEVAIETQNKHTTLPLRSLVSQEPQASPNKANDTVKPDPLSEAKLELIRLQIEIAQKEHSFKKVEHKRKMLYLHHEEVRKKQIHQMMLRNLQQKRRKVDPSIIDLEELHYNV